MRSDSTAVQPWYREPWPWLLMVGPAAVVVAGAITMTIAFRTSDGLVADDYYKQGLAINKRLARDERAAALGISTSFDYDSERHRARILLRRTDADSNWPAQITVRAIHPTRAELDRRQLFELTAPGIYEGALDLDSAQHWDLAIEAVDWRVVTAWDSRMERRVPR